MINLFLSALFLTSSALTTAPPEEQTNTKAQESGLRMGFNHGSHEISILFPKEHSLKYMNTEEGKQIYHSHHPFENQFISYQFAYQGYTVEGLPAFKKEYIASVQSTLSKKNPRIESKIVLDEKKSPNRERTIIEQHGETGKRTVFVADFITIEDRIYLISEMIETADSNPKETALLIDEGFFESVHLN